MSGFELWLSGHDSMSGTLMVLLWAAGVVTALVIVVGLLAFRDFAMRDMIDIFLRTAVVLVLVVLGWTWLEQSARREHAAERRALEVRESELTARAVAPGSALACLNPVGIETVDAACEQAVFASPNSVAATVAYVDAQLSLVADGLEYANRDRSYGGGLERSRRALEADRFGFVAHVLETRGCTAEDCTAFKLLRYTTRVKANLKEHAFVAHVTQYAANWPAGSVATTAGAGQVPSAITLPPSASAAPAVSRFNFPSSASIPPVSIMSAEPTGSTSPNNASGASTEPSASEPKKPPARRQSANKPAAARLPPPPVPPPASNPGTPPRTQ
jgi:hypothetical protein